MATFDSNLDAVTGSGGGSSPDQPTQFIFRPGYAGPSLDAGRPVYTDWATLYIDHQAATGRKEIIFDDSISSPCTIPVGTYDMADTAWVGAADLLVAGTPPYPLVEITDTSEVRNLSRIAYLQVQPTVGGLGTPLKFDSGGNEILVLERAWLKGNTPTAAAEISGGTDLSVSATSSLIGDTLAGVFYFADAASNNLDFDISVGTNVFQGTVGGASGGAGNTVGQINLGADCTFQSQSGFTPGLPQFNFTDKANQVEVDSSGMSIVTSDEVQGAIGELDTAVNGFTAYAPDSQQNVIYVGQHGNDGDTGSFPDDAKLTIASAISEATLGSPSASNRYVIKVLDAGIYGGAMTFPDYVSLDAPAATLDLTSIVCIMGIECSVRVHRAIGTVTCFNFSGAGDHWLKADYIETPSTAINASQRGTFEVGEIVITGAGVAVSANDNVQGRVGKITLTGAGIAVAAASVGAGFSGFIEVGEIDGVAGGTGVNVANVTTADVSVGVLNATTAVNTSTNGTLRLSVSSMTGAVAGSGDLFLTRTQEAYTSVTGASGAQAIDWITTDVYNISVLGDVTFSFTDPQSGSSRTIIYRQDFTGGRVITWPGSVVWVGSSTGVPDPGSLAFTVFYLTHRSNGTYYGTQSL